jgi:hypothetical protein
MDFTHMINAIKKNYEIELIQQGLKAKIDNIMLISDDIKDWKMDTLYIGHISHFSGETLPPIHAILCGKISEIHKNSHSNIAVIHEKDLNSIFNQISSMFYQSLRLSSEFSKLVAMLMRGESVTAIMNESANRVNNPIIVVDTSYHVLCYSNNFVITDPFWKVNIKRGYCTYEFILAVNEIISQQETPDDSVSFIVNCPASPKSKICSKIIWNNQVVGYTIMLEEDTPLQEFQIEFLPKISYIVADMLSKNPEFESIQGSNSEHILYHILNGEDELNIRARVEAAKIVFPENMRCIVVGTRPGKNPGEKTDKHVLRSNKEKLNTIFPHNYSTYYKNSIVFVIKMEKDEKLTKEQEQKLYEVFTNEVMTIGISQSFHNIFALKQYFNQCVHLQEIAYQMGITKQLMYYENYIFENILNHSKDTNHLLDYVHPALPTLRDYDIQNDSSLYETLRMYLECKYNLKQTSLRLFIHRNSLTYRMEKIIELTKINLDDVNTLFWLEMSYRMEYYLGI